MQEELVPQVSIIVPVYNVEGYLRRCLNSIQGQTLKEWECICVDDGSPDGCGVILDEYAAKDSRFVVIHQENGGTSRARNAGLDAARAEYIGFADPDDWIESGMYEALLAAARRTGADIVQCGYFAEKEDGSFPSKEKKEGFFDVGQKPQYYSSAPWDNFVKRQLVSENGIRFPPGVRKGQDTDFLMVAYALAKSSFYLNLPLYHYDTTRESSISHNETREIIIESIESRKKAFAKVEEICGKGGGIQEVYCLAKDFLESVFSSAFPARVWPLSLKLSGSKQIHAALLSQNKNKSGVYNAPCRVAFRRRCGGYLLGKGKNAPVKAGAQLSAGSCRAQSNNAPLARSECSLLRGI